MEISIGLAVIVIGGLAVAAFGFIAWNDIKNR